MKIEILDKAEQDIVNGFWFYERQSAGLGDYFLDSTFSDIESLHLYAGIHAQHSGYHRLLAKRFPFALYYRIEGRVIRVYAILDCRQNPLRAYGRLTDS